MSDAILPSDPAAEPGLMRAPVRGAASSTAIAEEATFRSFANCYLREVDAGRRVVHALGDGAIAPAIEWSAARAHLVLRAELIGWSACGPLRFGRIWAKAPDADAWRLVEPVTAVLALAHELYGAAGAGDRATELDLVARLIDSCRAMARALGRCPAPGDDAPFIAAEQGLAFGHFMHPTPKSRDGLSFWQEKAYAPEGGGRFQLAWFAVDAALIREDSAANRPATALLADLLGDAADRLGAGPGEILLPAHPLQAEALRLDPEVAAALAAGRIRPLGHAGPAFTATSSVRTVYSAEQRLMLKFSLPVRITNSLRVSRRHELAAGVAMARLFRSAGIAADLPNFTVIHDIAFATLDLGDRPESGFEVILRENPFTVGAEQGIAMVAALTAEPLPGERSRLAGCVERAALRAGIRRDRAALAWFDAYLAVTLDPLVRLYDRHGIALEAHQQNTLVDVSAGFPSRGFYRDNQGFYLSAERRAALCRLLPDLAAIDGLFFDDAEIARRFSYYLVVNQLFAVVSRMAADGLADEPALLARLGRRLDALAATLHGPGRAFVRLLLDSPVIAVKANLGLRARGVDELEARDGAGVYVTMPSPLYGAAARADPSRIADAFPGGARAIA